MNRREFLKALGLLAAAAALPDIPALAAYPNFDPDKQYGDYVLVTELDKRSKNYLQEIKDLFEEQIKEFIPPKYRDQITWIIQEQSVPENWPGSVAWKYTPKRKGALAV